MEEVAETIRQTLNERSNGTSLTMFVDVGNMSFARQVQIASRTFLYATPAGGISMLSVFLPAKATSLLGNFCDDCYGCSCCCCNNYEVERIFDALSARDNIAFYVYPVRPEDRVLPKKKDGCDFRMGDKSWIAEHTLEAYDRFYSEG